MKEDERVRIAAMLGEITQSLAEVMLHPQLAHAPALREPLFDLVRKMQTLAEFVKHADNEIKIVLS